MPNATQAVQPRYCFLPLLMVLSHLSINTASVTERCLLMQNRPPVGGLFCDCVFYENECSETRFIFPVVIERNPNILWFSVLSSILYILYCVLARVKMQICPIFTAKMTTCTIIDIDFCAIFFDKSRYRAYNPFEEKYRLTNVTKNYFTI